MRTYKYAYLAFGQCRKNSIEIYSSDTFCGRKCFCGEITTIACNEIDVNGTATEPGEAGYCLVGLDGAVPLVVFVLDGFEIKSPHDCVGWR